MEILDEDMAKPPKGKKPKKKKQVGRGTKNISITGVTGCGKSYEAKRIARKLGHNNKVLVISYAGSGKTWDMCKKIAPTPEALNFKSGWRKIHYVEHESEKPLQQIYDHYSDGIVILDDCSAYMSSNWSTVPGLKILAVDHRHIGVDLMFIAHSPLHIPKQCWAFIKYSWLFKCTMKLERSLMPMDNFDNFLKAQEAVNKKYILEQKKQSKAEPRGVCKYIRN